MAWLKWVVLVGCALWALSTNLTVRKYYKTSSTPMLPANTFAFFRALSVVGVMVLHRSPFHLQWLFPISYLAGFFSLRSRVVAFFPWLWGYLLAYTIPKNW